MHSHRFKLNSIKRLIVKIAVSCSTLSPPIPLPRDTFNLISCLVGIYLYISNNMPVIRVTYTKFAYQFQFMPVVLAWLLPTVSFTLKSVSMW